MPVRREGEMVTLPSSVGVQASLRRVCMEAATSGRAQFLSGLWFG